MDRAEIALYLDHALPNYRKEFLLDHWELPIDNALRTYGIAELDAPDIPTAGEESVRQLAVYYALQIVERVAASRVTISVGNPPSSKAANQAYTQIREQRAEQARVLATLGYSVNARGMVRVRMPVPYLEIAETDL